ncbi:hypothetical protein [Rhodoplanes azumiensis]|uniref:DUF2306 domain-containing protein n=1 Tax=Rhodoplanes azumiensis TaxID=1897628 RepID=A0ABW5AS27_9BRAD
MIVGLPMEAFTYLHVAISLTGVLSGIVAMTGMAFGRRMPGLTFVFLAATFATSASGFLYPANAVGVRHVVGAALIVLLTAALVALYVARLRRGWRLVYVCAALVALWFNTSAAVVQAFRKIPVLTVRAGDDVESWTLALQVTLGVGFVLIGALALRRGSGERPAPMTGSPAGGSNILLRVPTLR